jgi:hypothetical protein
LHGRFKAIMLDIGLMRHLSGMPGDIEYAKKDRLSIYREAVCATYEMRHNVELTGRRRQARAAHDEPRRYAGLVACRWRSG